MEMRIDENEKGIIVSGYANAVERISRPLYDYNENGEEEKFEEIIEQGCFERALQKNPYILMLKDHDWSQVVANTIDGSLNLKEDAIGLRYVAKVSDPQIRELFGAGMVKGCSFGFVINDQDIEEREGQLPLHRVKDIDLFEITLVCNQAYVPAYYATTAESRAVKGAKQIRSCKCDINITPSETKVEPKVEKEPIDYKDFEDRISKLK